MRESRRRLASFSIVFALFLVDMSPVSASNVTVGCGQLQDALTNANDGDVVILDDFCTGMSFQFDTGTDITLKGTTGSGFDGTGAPNRLLTGIDLGSVRIEDLIFRDGSAEFGGAINLSGNTTPTIVDNRFYGNTATIGTGVGGAVYIQIASDRVATVRSNVFGGPLPEQRNSANKTGGAAFYDGDTLNLVDNLFENNSSELHGGGAFAIGWAHVVASGNRFLHNETVGFGGGFELLAETDVSLVGNTFEGNVASHGAGPTAGGAGLLMFVPDGLTNVTITQARNRFVRNTAGPASGPSRGGGEWLMANSPTTFTSTSDRFIGNEVLGTDVASGAIHVDQLDPTTLSAGFRNMVAADNSLAGGSARVMHANACGDPGCAVALTMANSSLVANSGGAPAQITGNAGVSLAVRNSIVYGSEPAISGIASPAVAYSDLCNAPGVPAPGAGNICVDPRLVSPSTGNVHQRASSPTRENGSNALVPGGLSSDYEGSPRIIDSDANGSAVVDMGADESLARPRISGKVRRRSRYRIAGGVAPANPGRQMKVGLFRRSSRRYRLLATKRLKLDANSRYVALFKRPKPGRCRVIVTFLGSPTTLRGERRFASRC